jgi:hypothetical protein
MSVKRGRRLQVTISLRADVYAQLLAYGDPRDEKLSKVVEVAAIRFLRDVAGVSLPSLAIDSLTPAERANALAQSHDASDQRSAGSVLTKNPRRA